MHHETGVTPHEELRALPAKPPADWSRSGGVAVAELPAGAPVVPDPPLPQADEPPPAPPTTDREKHSLRPPSTSTLGGTFASIVFHLWLLSMLATLTGSRPEPPAAPAIDSTILQEEQAVPDTEELTKFELTDPKDKDYESGELVAAASIGQMKSVEPRPQQTLLTDDFNPLRPGLAVPAMKEIVSQGLQLDERITVKGTTGDAMVPIEAALDRVTWEIANHLTDRKALVVWLLDASGSLKTQRATISARLRRIYGELGALEEAGKIVAKTDQALLSGVVMYGERTLFVTPEPTDKFDVIQDAVKNAPTDPSGVENVFGAVEQVMHRWQKYRTSNGRSILLIIVTDETGDDFDHLEPAILSCKRYGAKAYVIGPPAVFGRRQAFVPYVAPEDKKTYQLPVDLGPESFTVEVASLPFWFSASQYEFLSAGMGPYGLSRLVRESGGAYFLTGMTTSAGLSPIGNFDPQALKAFEPDYRFGTPQDYVNDANRHKLRQAVMRAAELSLKYKAGSTPRLELRVTPQNYLQQLTDAQKSAAETTYMVDAILSAFQGNLEAEYQKESSPRWRANYNLTLGRLLALKVRAQEYNSACAQLKQLGSGDVASKTNHWIFRPSKKFGAGAVSKKLAAEAARLLGRAVDDAPGTPWALLAQRDLSIPLGFDVVQKYDPPPKPQERRAGPAGPAKKQVRLADDTKKKPPAPPPPPPPPPKLPKL
ncbi:MAG: vWA domain-containing protein [Deltaproteobacteria bacterium]